KASSAASGFSSESRSRRSSQSAPAAPITGAIRRPVSGCSDWNARAGAAFSNTRIAARTNRDCEIIAMMSRVRWILPCLLLAALGGCGSRDNSLRIDYPMGERVTVGSLTYNVVETAWRSQLGDAFKIRIPDQRFLLITLTVTNGGGRLISVPLLTL